MSQQQDKNPLFDGKTMIAMLVIAGFYMGWNFYLSKKYPKQAKAAVTESAQVATGAQASATGATEPAKLEAIKQGDAKSNVEQKALNLKEEKVFNFESEKLSFKVSSKGMGLHDVALKSYKDRETNENVQVGISDKFGLYELRLAGEIVDFDIVESEKGHFVGTANLSGMTIKRDLIFNSENGSISSKIAFGNPSDLVTKGVSLLIPEQIHKSKGGSFLMPSYDIQDFYVGHSGGSSDAVHFSTIKEDLSKQFKNASLVSVGSQYFAAALLDKSEVLPELNLKASFNDKTAMAEVVYKPASLKSEIDFNQILYVGPKSVEAMQNIDPELATIINYGWFAAIAKVLLTILKGSYSLVGNWGLAIILLTLLVRFLVLPFNLYSARSMKAMQRIQPQIASLKERYKDDAARMNQEMMALMKENKANPLGGCLPMLLQLPVFFALWRVINSSIELYQSPFAFWITDLSLHDKFYVLPVLMGVTMFFQQKLTPTAMDPAQAKIMQFIPVIFTVFMLQIPSGLALYMVVSTTFGIIQQYLMLKDRTATA